MADWIVCAGCQLKHSRRPDGLCPRCKQPADGGGAVAAASEELPPLPAATPSAFESGTAGLGDLAQSARGKELKNARGVMLAVGILTVLVNGFFFFTAESTVQAEIDKEIAKIRRNPYMTVDQAKVAAVKEAAVAATRLINGGGMLLGIVFLVCAAKVYARPVPATVTALAVYLAGTAMFAFLEPTSLTRGLILKVFVTVALFKAVQAARAYQKEEAENSALAA